MFDVGLMPHLADLPPDRQLEIPAALHVEDDKIKPVAAIGSRDLRRSQNWPLGARNPLQNIHECKRARLRDIRVHQLRLDEGRQPHSKTFGRCVPANLLDQYPFDRVFFCEIRQQLRERTPQNRRHRQFRNQPTSDTSGEAGLQ